jgi:hypothetical protein
MSNCAFGLPEDNRVLSGTLTASSEAAGLGPGQWQNDHGATSTAWTTLAGVTEAYVDVDAGVSVDWHAFGLFNTNLTTDCLVRWRVGDDVTMATWNHNSGLISGTVSAGYRQSLYFPGTTWTGRYARVRVEDTTNPEMVIRIAQAFMGVVRVPIANFGYATTTQRLADRGVLVSRGGQEFPDYRYCRRVVALDLPSLRAAEALSVVEAIERGAEQGGNILFLPYPAGADLARQAVFGRLAESRPIRFPAPSPVLRAWSATITERL